MTTSPPITAVIPAAGSARRLGETISGSKEVTDVGGVPVMAHLLRRLRTAGIDRAIATITTSKLDIPASLPPRYRSGIAFVVVDGSPSPVHSIRAALALAGDVPIALGFPDVIVEPEDAFIPLLDRMAATGADVVLGLFPTDIADRVDMVRLDNGRPVEIVIKRPRSGLTYSWCIAVWAPRFSTLLLDAADRAVPGETQVGEVIQMAIDTGLEVEAVTFPDGGYLDIGTPADLERARTRYGTS